MWRSNVRDLIAGWLEDGWLEVADAARKTRRYRLSAYWQARSFK
jgi:hypothetical protein